MASETKESPSNNPGLHSTPDEAIIGYFMQQTMFRIKDPKISLDFYSPVLGMSLLKRLDFPEMKFSLYFMGDEKVETPPTDPSQRTVWTFGQKATIELTQEKDVDEVLQSHTVYSNVSKGVLAKSKDMIAAFGTNDLSAICTEIMQKGELQVAGKERDSQLSTQKRDIATIVMQKTINTETQRPYTINMIESLMHEIHFAVDPHNSSKKQALEVIRELQKHFPIKRAPMRLRLIAPEESLPSLMEKLNAWNAEIVSKDESGNQLSLVCEIEPSFFRDCDALVRNLHGRVEILAVSVHFEKDTNVDHYDDHEDFIEPSHHHPTVSLNTAELDEIKLSEGLQKQSFSTVNNGTDKVVSAVNDDAEKSTAEKNVAEVEVVEVKQSKCSTCNAFVGDTKQYREHFKSEWHKHNLRRKTRQLPPLTADECLESIDMGDAKSDLKEYSF